MRPLINDCLTNPKMNIREERCNVMTLVNQTIMMHPGVWLTAQDIADKAKISRQRAAWALKKLVAQNNMIECHVVRTAPTKSRSFEQHKEYRYLYREVIGANRWCQILGIRV